MLAVFCLLLLPAATFAAGVVVDSCGRINVVDNNTVADGVCVLAGGNATYNAKAISGLNSFDNIASPVEIHGLVGATNFELKISSFPVWAGAGPVPTFLSLVGNATLQVGATVNITLTGTLGGPPLQIKKAFANNGNAMRVVNFADFEFANQAIADVAELKLEVMINGNATVVLPDSAEFQGQIPEPATLFLFGTGLAGVAMRMRKKLRKHKET